MSAAVDFSRHLEDQVLREAMGTYTLVVDLKFGDKKLPALGRKPTRRIAKKRIKSLSGKGLVNESSATGSVYLGTRDPKIVAAVRRAISDHNRERRRAWLAMPEEERERKVREIQMRKMMALVAPVGALLYMNYAKKKGLFKANASGLSLEGSV